MKFDIVKLKDYPISSGVYLMLNRSKAIVYIGKAKNLRARLRQYFQVGGDGRWIIPYLQEQVVEIDTVVTNSEKEALLLENTLIKKHKPRFNALLKDDKSYIAIKINTQHPWPMASLIRYKGQPKKEGLLFGPYTSAHSARQTVDLLQRLFPLRQCSDQELLRRTRPCILYDMKRCSAPCVGLIDHATYEKYVNRSIQFLRGDCEEAVKQLEKELETAVEKLEFERAGEIHRLLQSIETTLQTQAVDKPLQGLSGDVIGIYRQGDEIILSQLIFTKGKLHAYKHHNFAKVAENDDELITSFLVQNYRESDMIPKEILVPIELEDRKTLEEILNTEINVPQRGEKKALIKMAYLNAEAAYKQQKDANSIRERTLLELKEHLKLNRFPQKIECIDTSHFSGTEAVSALVRFYEGVPDKEYYRRYKLRSYTPGDDYGALREVMIRRYDKPSEEQDLPDLLVIDGGKGHLNMARQILQELNIASVDLIGLAKEEGRHDKGATQESIYSPDIKDPIHLSPHSLPMFLLQRIRDEAHRFAIHYQTKRRTKTTIKSELSEIPGIGPKKLQALLKAFGSAKKILAASEEELKAIRPISKKDIEAIRNWEISKSEGRGVREEK